MIIKLIERLFPRGIFYDNTARPQRGEYITLTSGQIEFTPDTILIIDDNHLFFGLEISQDQKQQIIDNHFIDGEIICNSGRVVYKLNENLYRLYDSSGVNWVRVSRENLLAAFDFPNGMYGEVNPVYTGIDDGVRVSEPNYH